MERASITPFAAVGFQSVKRCLYRANEAVGPAETISIKGKNGKVGKAMVADRNTDVTIDLCMDLWQDFGYDAGGGVSPVLAFDVLQKPGKPD